MHHGAELELDPLRHTEPMELVAHDSCQSAVVFLRARDNAGVELLVRQVVIIHLMLCRTVLLYDDTIGSETRNLKFNAEKARNPCHDRFQYTPSPSQTPQGLSYFRAYTLCLIKQIVPLRS